MELALKQFGQLVYDYCGLNYLDNLQSLQMKMQKRLTALSIANYWAYIRYVDEHPEEWPTIVELLTINETYFFREDKQFAVLQQEVVPKLLSDSKQRLTIWCAACSTGDEPYSIAMTLNEFIQSEQIQILATDINQRVLQSAKTGAYSKNSLSFRRIPQHWLTAYFDETATQYIVKETLRQAVQFDYANLCKLEEYYFTEQLDVIFCRNVLIYFDDRTIEAMIKKFYQLLKPGGYLFLGHAETITKFNSGFKTISSGGTFYYQKG